MRGLRREARGWREKIDGDKRGGEQLLRPSWPPPIENLPQLHPWGPRIHPYIAHALLFYASQTASSHSFSPRAPAVYNLQFLSSRLLVPIHHDRIVLIFSAHQRCGMARGRADSLLNALVNALGSCPIGA